MQDFWFKDWFNSHYYHLLYKNRDNNEASLFIDALIQYLKPEKNSTMLDVACGKGRHSIHLANMGFDVTGIDLSGASIDEALKHEADNLHFYQHDMRQTFWVNYFDYVFNFFTSFGYFDSEREHINALESMIQSMKNNGTFVIDYLNSKYTENHIIHQEEKNIEGISFKITKWYDDHKFYKKILIDDPTLSNPTSYTEVVARFSLDHFKNMFQKTGIEIKEIFGDYQLNKFNEENSPRLIMICKKMN